jgi:hypothetical protein
MTIAMSGATVEFTSLLLGVFSPTAPQCRDWSVAQTRGATGAVDSPRTGGSAEPPYYILYNIYIYI